MEPALTLLEKCHELCHFSEVQGMYSVAVGSLGYAYLLAKEPRRALNLLEEAVEDNYLRASFWPAHPLIVLADTYRDLGETALAIETVSRALKLTGERGERGFEAWAILVMAGACDGAERPEDAKAWYRRALQQASDLSMLPLVAHCRRGLGELYLRQGEKSEAESESMAAQSIYNSLGMTYWHTPASF